MVTYRYSSSTFDADTYVAELNRELRAFCNKYPVGEAYDKEALMSLILRRTGIAAYQAVDHKEGKPFGAVVVDFNTADNIPQIVGFGTNHGGPTNDPSAHAEVTAIRDAAKRTNRTDLSGLTLITSSECCPMCLAAATGCKIDNVYFGLSRYETDKLGFSDRPQYDLMSAGGIELQAQKVSAQDAEKWLQGHDAAVVVPYKGKEHVFHGDTSDAAALNPVDMPCIQAIRNACGGLAAIKTQEAGEKQKVSRLPLGAMLISRNMPHPVSLMTADCARIGRTEDQYSNVEPGAALQKDTTKILYVNESPETMPVRAADGRESVREATEIWQEIRQSSATHLPKDQGHAITAGFSLLERQTKAEKHGPG